MFLSPTELRDLTARQHADAQIAALTKMGIRFVVAADGRPRVSRAAVEALLGAKEPRKPARREAEIRWDLVR